MNRTDRLLAIVLELQAKRLQRAEDLARTFEVSKRTIYRDVLALMESGVPVISLPGEGYALMEGYFLPPLTFNPDEATMLLLGTDFMAQNFDAQYRAAAESAGSKIVAVLPDALRTEVEYLQRCIRFISSASPAAQELLQHLRRAIIQRRTVRFSYTTRFPTDYKGERNADDTAMFRDADPYGLIHVGQTWYLIAYCHLRRDRRTFRLERMSDLTLLDKTFTRPLNFVLGVNPDTDRNLTVRVLFDADIAPWVKESRSYFIDAFEDRTDGLLVILRVRHEEEIMQWLLGWGRHILHIEPESLRQHLTEEAETLLRNLSTSSRVTSSLS